MYRNVWLLDQAVHLRTIRLHLLCVHSTMQACQVMMPGVRADTQKWQACCLGSLHALVWAATPAGQGAFKPLSKAERARPLADLAAAWGPALQSARSQLQAAVSTACEDVDLAPGAPVAKFAPFAVGDGQPARKLTAAEASVWHLAREGTAYAVCCALVLEVLGESAGLLPRGGWQRANAILSECMVRRRSRLRICNSVTC
jgi:hypothetical protein